VNIPVLKYLVEVREDLIDERLAGTKYDSAATIGVAKLLIGNGGDTMALSPPQLFHYETFIKPLLFVECEGPVGYVDDEMKKSSCVHCTHIDDESLLLCYHEEDFVCQNCRYDRDKMASA
jgi:hypothetical protein